MTRPRAVATWVVATVAIVLASACSQKPSPEAAALVGVVRGAQTAELNLETVPAGYHGPGTSAELVQPALDHVQTELAKYYVGALLARKAAQCQNGIRGMAEGGGGGRDLDVHLVKDGGTWKIDQEHSSSRRVEVPKRKADSALARSLCARRDLRRSDQRPDLLFPTRLVGCAHTRHELVITRAAGCDRRGQRFVRTNLAARARLVHG